MLDNNKYAPTPEEEQAYNEYLNQSEFDSDSLSDEIWEIQSEEEDVEDLFSSLDDISVDEDADEDETEFLSSKQIPDRHGYPTGKIGQTSKDRRYNPPKGPGIVKKSDLSKIHGKGHSISQKKEARLAGDILPPVE